MVERFFFVSRTKASYYVVLAGSFPRTRRMAKSISSDGTVSLIFQHSLNIAKPKVLSVLLLLKNPDLMFQAAITITDVGIQPQNLAR